MYLVVSHLLRVGSDLKIILCEARLRVALRKCICWCALKNRPGQLQQSRLWRSQNRRAVVLKYLITERSKFRGKKSGTRSSGQELKDLSPAVSNNANKDIGPADINQEYAKKTPIRHAVWTSESLKIWGHLKAPSPAHWPECNSGPK